jgi:hypothetical protein
MNYACTAADPSSENFAFTYQTSSVYGTEQAMRSLTVVAFLVCLCIAAVGEVNVVSLVDSTPPGSPLSNIGTATLSEVVVNGKMDMQHTEKWTPRNVSSKSIVTVVETLHVHYTNGSNTISNFEYELFFHPQLLMPNELLGRQGTQAAIDALEGHLQAAESRPGRLLLP